MRPAPRFPNTLECFISLPHTTIHYSSRMTIQENPCVSAINALLFFPKKDLFSMITFENILGASFFSLFFK